MFAFMRNEDRHLNATIVSVVPSPRPNNPPDTCLIDSPFADIFRGFEETIRGMMVEFESGEKKREAKRAIVFESSLARTTAAIES